MRTITTLFTLLVLAACGGGEEAASADEMEPMVQEEATSPMADFAGTWQATSMLEGTPDPVTSTIEVSPDGSEWSMMFEGRDPVPMTVSMEGDSVIMVTDPYESVLRDGVMVTVRTSSALQGPDRMVGTIVATYATPDGETEVTGTMESVRGGM